MNLSAIDLNLLVALDALIAEAHVGRAARRIGVSQPAASHALKRLRGLLADPLLVRVGSKMELTPRAAGLRESLAETLHRVHTLLADESFDPRRSVRRFAIMMQDHVAHLVVPALVTRMHEAAPGVTLDVLPWQSPASLTPERLRAIDLVLSCSDADIPGFQRAPLFMDTEVAVVRTRHPSLARLRKLAPFLRASHVAVAGLGLTEDPVDAWLRHEGVSRRIVLRVPSYLQALQAVARADLVAVVPRRLAEAHAKPWSLTLLRPPLDPGQYQEYVFHPRRLSHDPASMWLRRVSHRLFG